ncbi:uncharacterized protein EI97DRAFT_477474 [Westerdykella ornata]|uniref:Aminoglycoside phosphotransferase domain-containing protein n=1 Tax=Westerdykella ornata TaxID=318751 RepID=A0A6A6JY67_WESOR|nr:uncharacterized protein EI97DRAFT_477474 [Westerdykella ornata]KAF2279969.1 hypothetical protein EI97DRAFT_477474 [Westerdykella ornata]
MAGGLLSSLTLSYDIVGIIDWEVTYAAPAGFLAGPPWWITGTEPFEWNEEDGRHFNGKWEMFVAELEEEERVRGETEHEVSRSMKRCMADGTFWYNLAIRESMKLAEVIRHCVDTEPFRSFWTERAVEDDLARLAGFMDGPGLLSGASLARIATILENLLPANTQRGMHRYNGRVPQRPACLTETVDMSNEDNNEDECSFTGSSFHMPSL